MPLIRSYDNSTQPVIGQPWSPDISKSHAGIASLSSLSPSPKDPVLSVRACAGPMSQTYVSVQYIILIINTYEYSCL